jgi:hypothetical protein
MYTEQASAPLKLIFAKIADKDGNIKEHVAFYDIFGGIAEVVSVDDDNQAEQVGPELIIAPINKYMGEVVTMWITPEQKEKICKAIRDMFDNRDQLAMIFSGKPVSTEPQNLTDTGFCVEAMRAALPILPKVPVNCISTQKLYTILKLRGGS